MTDPPRFPRKFLRPLRDTKLHHHTVPFLYTFKYVYTFKLFGIQILNTSNATHLRWSSFLFRTMKKYVIK